MENYVYYTCYIPFLQPFTVAKQNGQSGTSRLAKVTESILRYQEAKYPNLKLFLTCTWPLCSFLHARIILLPHDTSNLKFEELELSVPGKLPRLEACCPSFLPRIPLQVCFRSANVRGTPTPLVYFRKSRLQTGSTGRDSLQYFKCIQFVRLKAF